MPLVTHTAPNRVHVMQRRLADLMAERSDDGLEAIIAQYADEPSREDDERDLQLIAVLEENGIRVVFDGEGEGDTPNREAGKSETPGAPGLSPTPFVSPYLQRPLRSEAEVRAALARPANLGDLIARDANVSPELRKLFEGYAI